jgi:hypothetical protein
VLVTLTKQPSASALVTPTKQRELVCHPDEASIASGRKDLGQLRASEAGSGFSIAQRSLPMPHRTAPSVRRCDMSPASATARGRECLHLLRMLPFEGLHLLRVLTL